MKISKRGTYGEGKTIEIKGTRCGRARGYTGVMEALCRTKGRLDGEKCDKGTSKALETAPVGTTEEERIATKVAQLRNSLTKDMALVLVAAKAVEQKLAAVVEFNEEGDFTEEALEKLQLKLDRVATAANEVRTPEVVVATPPTQERSGGPIWVSQDKEFPAYDRTKGQENPRAVSAGTSSYGGDLTLAERREQTAKMLSQQRERTTRSDAGASGAQARTEEEQADRYEVLTFSNIERMAYSQLREYLNYRLRRNKSGIRGGIASIRFIAERTVEIVLDVDLAPIMVEILTEEGCAYAKGWSTTKSLATARGGTTHEEHVRLNRL